MDMISFETTPHILFAPDIDYVNEPLNAAWIASFVDFLQGSKTSVDFVARFPGPHRLHDRLAERGVSVIEADEFEDPDSVDSAGVKARFRSRQVVSVALDTNRPEYGVILTQGLSLSRYIAGNGTLQALHWALIDDDPFADAPKFHTLKKDLDVVAEHAKIILTASAVLRRQLETQVPASTSKTRLLPHSALTRPSAKTLLTEPKYTAKTFAIDFQQIRHSPTEYDFTELASALITEKNPPRFILTHYPVSPSPDDIEFIQKSALEMIPGIVKDQQSLYASDFRSSKSTLLLPLDMEASRRELIVAQAQDFGFNCRNLMNGQIGDEIRKQESSLEESQNSFSNYFSRDLPDFEAVPVRKRQVRVLLAGADFKFAGDIVDGLIQRRDVDLQVDLFEANAKPQPEKSKPLLEWAEIILAEFASKNAIWYSQNVLPSQKLIVHLHGYELLQDWIDELVIENCHRIVFASEFYRAKAIDLKEWPEDKLVVIPNSVNPGDLERQKDSSARFHLGIVGIVPILKRPDRVLDLLEELLKHDDRYVLHIKGHSPWSYAWEWKRSAHQDSYRRFYARIGESKVLSQHVVFEPFSPDIGNWLTKIGWILSPSTRETFHLSAIEGAASGAVPIAWRREGSEEIIGSEHNVDNTGEAVSKVLSARKSADFQTLAQQAKLHASRFDVLKIKSQWLQLVFNGFDEIITDHREADSKETRVIQEIETALDSNAPEAALALLDENIPLSRHSIGPLKDIEHYVRGMVALDEKRLTQFLPISNTLIESDEFIVVRPSGASNLALVLSGIDDAVIDIEPPRYLTQSDRFVPKDDTEDFLPDPGTLHYQNTNRIRLDRWVHSVKIAIENFAEIETPAAHLIAQGPWWVAMPTALAADQLGLPFTWIIDGSDETLSDLERFQDTGNQSDFRLQSIISVFNRADLRLIVDPGQITNNMPYWHVDGSITLNSTDSYAGIPAIPSQSLRQFILTAARNRIDSPSPHLLKPLSAVRVGLIGAPDLHNELRGLVKEVISLPIQDFDELITPEVDVVIIDEAANNEGEWKGRIESPNTTVSRATSKIFDRGRLMGAATVFIHRANLFLSNKFFSTARKADTIATFNAEGLSILLEEHPTSISRLAYWNTSHGKHSRWTRVFRAAGVPVELN